MPNASLGSVTNNKKKARNCSTLNKRLAQKINGELKSSRKVFVYKIQVNPIHTILKYGIYYDFMDR